MAILENYINCEDDYMADLFFNFNDPVLPITKSQQV